MISYDPKYCSTNLTVDLSTLEYILILAAIYLHAQQTLFVFLFVNVIFKRHIQYVNIIYPRP